jgi:Domain of unknown function (DUF5615)
VARFYANENFPQPVAIELRNLGHDVLTTLEASKSGRGIPDEEVLDLVQADGRAVLTLNRKHFVRLHRTRPMHAGIIVCTYDPDFVGRLAESTLPSAVSESLLVSSSG